MRIFAAEKKHALTRGKIQCLGEVATINPSRGCAGKCAFCYARCFTGAPQDDRVLLYTELPAKLRAELESKRRRKPVPSFVLFSTAGDPFLGGPLVEDVSRACIEILLRRHIGVSLTTRGIIPDDLLTIMTRFRSRIRISLAITSLSEDYHRAWEPYTASPESRLAQLERLVRHGLAPTVRVEPIIPYVNDGTAQLRDLFSALNSVGIADVTLSFLQLRKGVADQIRNEAPKATHRLVLGSFPSEQRSQADKPLFDYLPLERARASLRRIQRLGQQTGIRVLACRCQNPGIPATTCVLAPECIESATQTTLFDTPDGNT